MESQDPLNQLADIHLPEPVGFWPLAPGWWILAGVLLLCLAVGLFRLWQALIRQKRKRSALRELEQAYGRFQESSKAEPNQRGLDFLYAVNSILKRVALVTDTRNREEIPELSGNAWLRYLDEAGENPGAFTEGSGQILAQGPYQPEFRGDARALFQLAEQWVSRRYELEGKAGRRGVA